MISQLSILDLQFSGKDAEKANRLVGEVKKLQQKVNSIIAEMNAVSVKRSTGAPADLAIGEWDVTVVPGSPTVFRIRFNDGGTIRTGSLTLS